MLKALLPAIVMVGTVLPAQRNLPVRQVVEELRIDANEEDLSRIGFARTSSTGIIAVAQPDDHLVKLFLPDGSSRSFGRDGAGPGEFRSLARIGWKGDTLWVDDVQLHRRTFVGPDFELLRTESWQTEFEIPEQFRFRVHPFTRTTLIGLDGEEKIAVAFPSGPSSGLFIPVVRISPEGTVRELVVGYPMSVGCIESVTKGKTRMGTRMPFCPRPVIAFSSTGSRVATAVALQGDAALTIQINDWHGNQLYEREVEVPKTPISRSVADSAREAYEARGASNFEIPHFYPPFGAVAVGDDGWVWLERPMPGETALWWVLDAGGTPRVSVQLPRSIRIQEASQYGVLVVEPDDDGLEHVVRYRVFE